MTTQYSSVNVKLSYSQFNKLKSGVNKYSCSGPLGSI